MTRMMHSKASELKEFGNDCFKKNDFDGAINAYTEVIDVLDDNKNDLDNDTLNIIRVCLSNRALCYRKLKSYNYAIRDCQLALDIDENFLKALYTKALCLYDTECYDESFASFKRYQNNMGSSCPNEIQKYIQKCISKMDDNVTILPSNRYMTKDKHQNESSPSSARRVIKVEFSENGPEESIAKLHPALDKLSISPPHNAGFVGPSIRTCKCLYSLRRYYTSEQCIRLDTLQSHVREEGTVETLARTTQYYPNMMYL